MTPTPSREERLAEALRPFFRAAHEVLPYVIDDCEDRPVPKDRMLMLCLPTADGTTAPRFAAFTVGDLDNAGIVGSALPPVETAPASEPRYICTADCREHGWSPNEDCPYCERVDNEALTNPEGGIMKREPTQAEIDLVKRAIRDHSSPGGTGKGSIHGGQTAYIVYEPYIGYIAASIVNGLAAIAPANSEGRLPSEGAVEAAARAICLQAEGGNDSQWRDWVVEARAALRTANSVDFPKPEAGPVAALSQAAPEGVRTEPSASSSGPIPTEADLERLEKIRAAATQGEWALHAGQWGYHPTEYDPDDDGGGFHITMGVQERGRIKSAHLLEYAEGIYSDETGFTEIASNAVHIAAFNPQAMALVLSLAREGLRGRWRPIESAPRDGREIIGIDEHGFIRVCYPKRFPRVLHPADDMAESKPGDVWEYFRDDKYAPGHTWSFVPTHWMPLPAPPVAAAPPAPGEK